MVLLGGLMDISFRVDGTNCWKREDIKIEMEGSSSYKVIVEGSVREEDIICMVPDVHCLLAFLSRLFNGDKPVFQAQPELENTNPINKCD